MDYLFGVDIGGTTVKMGLLDYNGTIIDKFEVVTSKENNGETILPTIKEAMVSYLAKKGIDKNDVKGIGMGVPGPVSNGIVYGCVNLGWGVKNVVADFKTMLDWNPVVACGNDANVATLGEMSKGADGSLKNVVMFTLGTGVGGGIIINGKPVDGVHGAAGELGHMHVDKVHSYQCNCGLKGCLETVASATGVVRLAKDYLKTEDSSLKAIALDKLTCKDVFDAAKAGDALALKVVDEVGYYIGSAASLVAATVDPEAFIIGGGVSRAGSILIDAIVKHYQELAFKPLKQIPFILASLGNDGGMVGAALLAKI